MRLTKRGTKSLDPQYPAETLKALRASGFTGRTGHPAMYDALSRVGREFNPESYLEIGVYDGASVLSLILAAPNLKRIVLCDIFAKDWEQWAGGPRGSRNPIEAITRTVAQSGYTGDLRVIHGHSNIEIPKRTEKFDVITVDGDHTYLPAYNDVQNVLPLLNPGGILVLDDSTRGELRRITTELIEPAKLKHLFTLDDGDDATSVYAK